MVDMRSKDFVRKRNYYVTKFEKIKNRRLNYSIDLKDFDLNEPGCYYGFSVIYPNQIVELFESYIDLIPDSIKKDADFLYSLSTSGQILNYYTGDDYKTLVDIIHFDNYVLRYYNNLQAISLYAKEYKDECFSFFDNNYGLMHFDKNIIFELFKDDYRYYSFCQKTFTEEELLPILMTHVDSHPEMLTVKSDINYCTDLYKKVASKDISYLKYYKGKDTSIFLDALKTNPEELLSIMDELSVHLPASFFEEAIKYDESFAVYYYGSELPIDLIKSLIDEHPEVLKHYVGEDIDLQYYIDASKKENDETYLYFYGGPKTAIFYELLDKDPSFLAKVPVYNNYLLNDINFFRKAIKYDIAYLAYYQGTDLSIYYDILRSNPKDLKMILQYNRLWSDNLLNNIDFFREAIKVDPSFIKFYKGNDKSIYQELYNTNPDQFLKMIDSFHKNIKDLDFQREIIKNHKDLLRLFNSFEILKDINPVEFFSNMPDVNYILSPKSEERLSDALKLYELDHNYWYLYFELLREENKNKEALDFLMDVVKNDNTISIDFFSHGPFVGLPYLECSDKYMLELIQYKPEFVSIYKGNDKRIFDYIYNNAPECLHYIIDGFSSLLSSINSKDMKIYEKLCSYDINFIRYYQGSKKLYFKLLEERPDDLIKLPIIDAEISRDINFFRKAVKKNFEFLKFYEGDISFYYELLKTHKDEIIKYLSNIRDWDIHVRRESFAKRALRGIFNSYLGGNSYFLGDDYEFMKKLIQVEPKIMENYNGNCVALYEDLIKANPEYAIGLLEKNNKKLLLSNDNIFKYYLAQDPTNIIKYAGNNFDEMVEFAHLDPSIPYMLINRFYNKDKVKLIKNYQTFIDVLNKLNIDKNEFLQYQLAADIDWLEDILAVCDDDYLYESMNKLMSLIYPENDNSVVNKISNTVSYIHNYARYKDFIKLIIEKGNVDYKTIRFIFDKVDKIEELDNISDLYQINDILLKATDINMDGLDITELKNKLCTIIFNKTLDTVQLCLNTYGRTVDFKQLIFDNRFNPEFCSVIKENMVLITFMEDIVDCDDIESLKAIAYKLNDNREKIIELNKIYNNFEEVMRKLYEMDINVNLTATSRLKDESKYVSKDLSDKYGVKVYDYSNTTYCLLAHVMNHQSETPEYLCEGKSDSDHVFICLSAISYRYQKFYGDNIIFGYDELPEESFKMSSTQNMSSNSNGSISRGSSNVKEYYQRTQRSIIKTSSASRGNNEYLCMRQGLKPKYIIIPSGREPSSKEISIAKQYGLSFVITQERQKTIERPEPLEINKKEVKPAKSRNPFVNISDTTKQKKTAKRKRIAILTDPHASYEPTLAILEDIRKSGVDEIYSLGDNIGTGPNPSEVLDLLEEYGVQSIQGNHELYALEGVDKFKTHLKGEKGYKDAVMNSNWTKSKLTPEQMKRIKVYPKFIELMIGGKKVLLCHYSKNYNTGEDAYDASQYDAIFQGHIHKFNMEDKKVTVGGAGYDLDEPSGVTSYVILEEKPNGGYTMINKSVKFDARSLYFSTKISDMDEASKEKAESWSKGGR